VNAQRFGLELEYHNLELADSLDAVRQVYGDGEVVQCNDYKTELEVPDLGKFTLEMDTSFMQFLSEQASAAEKEGIYKEALKLVRDSAESLLEPFVPMEIVSPPLEGEALRKFDDLVTLLRAKGAVGTHHSFRFVLALHLNPEELSQDPDRLRRMMQAFFLLQDWLKNRTRRDSSRWLSQYATLYPHSYGQLLCSKEYAPDFETLVQDYLKYVKDRNTALDMLPLFSHIDETVLTRLKKSRLVKPRPAYHYRLPDSCVDNPEWTIQHQIELWNKVDQLAEDQEKLADLSALYLTYAASFSKKLTENWPEQVEEEVRKWGA